VGYRRILIEKCYISLVLKRERRVQSRNGGEKC
jgi:hypothetical protein